MPIHIDDYEQIIDGSNNNNISSALERAIKDAVEDEARIRIYFRVQETGTPSLRKIQEVRFDPKMSSIDDVKRIIIERLTEDPGPEFSGKIKLEFQNASNSTCYTSYQRTIKIGVLASDQTEYDDRGYNSSDTFIIPGENVSPGQRDEVIEMYKMMMTMKDTELRAKTQQVDAAMGYTFRMLSEQQRMFERATRMMENYTLRFGFPTPMPQMDMGSPNMSGPAPAESAGGGGLGLLPMLIKAASQIAGDNSSSAAPQAPRPQPSQPNRMGGVMAGAQTIQSMRPQPAHPVPGASPPPPMPHHDERGGLPEIGDPRAPMTRRPQITDSQYDEEYDTYGENEDDPPDGNGGSDAALKDFNNLDSDAMKTLVLGWVRSSPENKAAAMDMGTELISEIMAD
jgi:hypothetical protein